jgi:hypothetical protein
MSKYSHYAYTQTPSGDYVFHPIDITAEPPVIVEGLALLTSFEALAEKGAVSFHKITESNDNG